jgi:UDP-2,3-diacylglucosamine hydrolase
VILFVADIHLSPTVPRIVERFKAFLAGPVADAEALYLLGDVFEYWAGDDDLDDPFNRDMVAALRACADGGTRLYFIAGNRDFLINGDFAAAAGVGLLPDPYLLSVPAWQFVLSHGDRFCTQDSAYMAFRARVRNPAWQAQFLAQPLAQRKQQIAAIRSESERSKSAKAEAAPYLMDVEAGAVDDFLRENGYATLIHGHTHRPATHDHIVDGIHCQRWVLSDWHDDHGEAIVWDGETLSRLAV